MYQIGTKISLFFFLSNRGCFKEFGEQLTRPKRTLVVENPFVLIHTDVIKYYHVLVHSREKKVNST